MGGGLGGVDWKRGQGGICISARRLTAARGVANLANKSAASWRVSWSPPGSRP